MREIRNSKIWRICYYCGIWNFALFASTLKMSQKKSMQNNRQQTTKHAPEIWYGFDEEVRRNRGLLSTILETSIVIRGQKRCYRTRRCPCALLFCHLRAVLDTVTLFVRHGQMTHFGVFPWVFSFSICMARTRFLRWAFFDICICFWVPDQNEKDIQTRIRDWHTTK